MGWYLTQIKVSVWNGKAFYKEMFTKCQDFEMVSKLSTVGKVFWTRSLHFPVAKDYDKLPERGGKAGEGMTVYNRYTIW